VFFCGLLLTVAVETPRQTIFFVLAS